MELRWIERYEPVPRFGENIHQAVRVLQFRVPLDTGGVYMIDPDDRMTEWQDVPFVPTPPDSL